MGFKKDELLTVNSRMMTCLNTIFKRDSIKIIDVAFLTEFPLVTFRLTENTRAFYFDLQSLNKRLLPNDEIKKPHNGNSA